MQCFEFFIAAKTIPCSYHPHCKPYLNKQIAFEISYRYFDVHSVIIFNHNFISRHPNAFRTPLDVRNTGRKMKIVKSSHSSGREPFIHFLSQENKLISHSVNEGELIILKPTTNFVSYC